VSRPTNRQPSWSPETRGFPVAHGREDATVERHAFRRAAVALGLWWLGSHATLEEAEQAYRQALSACRQAILHVSAPIRALLEVVVGDRIDVEDDEWADTVALIVAAGLDDDSFDDADDTTVFAFAG
jgi:hypothetical protein